MCVCVCVCDTIPLGPEGEERGILWFLREVLVLREEELLHLLKGKRNLEGSTPREVCVCVCVCVCVRERERKWLIFL